MKKEKKEKRPKERTLKPTGNIDFDALSPAITGDPPVIVKDVALALKRKRADELITLCKVMSIEDNYVTLWDQTLGQMFAFNLVTDVSMRDHLKIYDPTKTCKKPRKPKPAEDVDHEIEEGDFANTLDDYSEGSDFGTGNE